MEKKLYRSRRSRVFGGIAGGLGHYFGLDPVIVRIIFVIVTLMHGLGIFLYIIMWIVIPEEPFELAYPIYGQNKDQNETANNDFNTAQLPKKNTGSTIFGVILIGIGMLLLADRIIPRFSFDDTFPFIVIAIGLFLIWNSLKSRGIK